MPQLQPVGENLVAGLVHDLSHPIMNLGNVCKLLMREWDSLEMRDLFARTVDRELNIMRRMLDDRVTDLPVVDASGRLMGMFRLDRLYAALLPKAALIGFGMEDLAFVSDTIGQLREKMREIEGEPVCAFAVKPNYVVHPDTTPLELVLLLHQGVNNIPVVEREGDRLIGMVSARDLLTALHKGGDE